jgi:Nitroreductase
MSEKFINNNFSDITFGRRSVRVYDENFKISHEEMLEMIQEATTHLLQLICNLGAL